MTRRIDLSRTGRGSQLDSKLSALEPSLVITLAPEWVELYKKWTTIKLTCARCGITYNDIDNIGSWKCKQHALGFNGEDGGYYRGAHVWDCCGSKDTRSIGIPSGCVRCDHRPKPINYTKIINDAIVPSKLLKYLNEMEPDAILDEEELVDYEAATLSNWHIDELVIIRRYDINQERARIQMGTSDEDIENLGGLWRNKSDLNWFRTR